MRWARGFSYKGVACVVALQKFGLRLYMAEEGFTNDQLTSIANDPLSRDENRALFIDSLVIDLKKAVKIVERKLLIPLFAKERERGAIVIRNDYNAIRQMYLYFRERAENWEELEAVVRVESGFATNQFLGLDIWEKWSVVLGKSHQSLRLKDKAFKVADKYRNFYAHGGIAKKSQSSYVHIPGVGSLTDPNFGDMRQPIFPFVEPELKQSDVTDVIFPFFDDVEKWLREGGSRFGMNYVGEGYRCSIRSGVPILLLISNGGCGPIRYLAYRKVLDAGQILKF